MTTPKGKTAVAYLRVSTVRQGQSGLGLEAQRASVTAFAQQENYTVLEWVTEVETGTSKRERPQLAAALKLAAKQDATLIIAKLDRLTRQVSFVSALMDSGVDFRAADLPEADRFTIHIIVAMAEREAQLISQRTKAALQARKARGLPLGNPANFSAAHRALGPQKRREAARNRHRQAEGLAEARRAAGASLRTIADELEQRGYPTAKGGRWSAQQVSNILRRAVGQKTG